MRWRIIALDLDGTLFTAENGMQVAAEDVAALQRAAVSGAIIMMNTGRHARSAYELWRTLGLPPGPAVVLHGAEVRGDDGVVVRARTLPRELARECLGLLAGVGAAARVDLAEATVWTGEADEPGFRVDTDATEPDLHLTLAESPRQLIVVGPGQARRALGALAHLEGRVRLLPLPDWEAPSVLHVLHPEATKGLALAYVAARHGVERSEILAAGDAWPDLSMLTLAGCGVAMDTSPGPVRALAARVVHPGPGWLARLLEEAW